MKIPMLVPKSSCLAQVKSKTGLFNCWFFFLVKAAAQYNGKHYLEASFILVFRQRRMYKSIKDNLQSVQSSFDWPNLLGYPVFKDKKYVCKQNVYPFIISYFLMHYSQMRRISKKSLSQHQIRALVNLGPDLPMPLFGHCLKLIVQDEDCRLYDETDIALI